MYDDALVGIMVAHFAATWLMVGLIWLVQLVHYPLFAFADATRFPAFARAHQTRIMWIVAPAMTTELGCATIVALLPVPGVTPGLAWTGLALVGLIWLATAMVHVPQHARLSRGFDARMHRALVRSNWVRTAAWSARGILAIVMLLRFAMAGGMAAR